MTRVFLLMLFLVTGSVSAQIETREQAEAFIGEYCVALVNEIAKAVARQKTQAEQEQWTQFMETGAYISGVADIYDKLCD